MGRAAKQAIRNEAKERRLRAAACRKRWGGELSPVDAKRLRRAEREAMRSYAKSERREIDENNMGAAGLDYTLRNKLLSSFRVKDIFDEWGLDVPDDWPSDDWKSQHETEYVASAIIERLHTYPQRPAQASADK